MSRKSIIILALTLLSLFVVLFWVFTRNDDTQINQSEKQSEISSELDSEESEQFNDETENTNKNNDALKFSDNVSDGNKNEATPFITFMGVVDGNLEIGAYVAILEEGGVCKAIITEKDTNTVKTYENNAKAGASTTDCEVFSIPISDLGSGSFGVQINYTSEKYNESSTTSEIEIP